MQCPNCQAEVPEGASFCAQCGASVATSAPVEEAAATAPSPEADPAANSVAPPEAPAASVPSAEPPEPASSVPPAGISPKERFEQMVAAKRAGEQESVAEEAVWEGSYSPKAMVGHFVVGGVVVILLAILLFKWLPFGKALIWWVVSAAIIEAVVFGWLLVRKLSVRYELTTQRLIHQKGLLSRVTDRIELIDVDDVTYRQGPVQRILGVGTIVITSSDRTHPTLEMPGIDPVREVSDRIDDLRREERRRRGLHIEAI